MSIRAHTMVPNYLSISDLYVADLNLQDVDIRKYYHEGTTSKCSNEIVDELHDELLRFGSVRIKFESSDYFITIDRGGMKAMMTFAGVPLTQDIVTERSCGFYITGEQTLAIDLLTYIQNRYKKQNRGLVSWLHRAPNGEVTQLPIVMMKSKEIRDEYYPWIREGVEAYLDRFLASESSILLILGPPGTGKTSLIRHMLTSRNLIAYITYDEELFSTDVIFSMFITSHVDVLVIEDADRLIDSRHQGNHLMSRFLNSAEGLVKVKSKKMIFTTNLDNVRDVDDALIRPGRCFDVMHARPLTREEARAASTAAGICPDLEQTEFTLAEIFADTRSSPILNRKVGF